MAQHSRGTTVPGRSPASLPEPAAAHRLLSLDIVLALLALAGGLRVLYLAAPAPVLPAEAANVAHAYALGHLTAFADAGGAGGSPFCWWQLSAYTMLSDAFGRSATALVAVREAMLVVAVLGAGPVPTAAGRRAPRRRASLRGPPRAPWPSDRRRPKASCTPKAATSRTG